MTGEQKLKRIREKSFFARGDLVIYAVLLLLIAAFTLCAFLGNKEKGTRLEILYCGETIFSASLSKDALYVFYIDGEGKGKVIEGDKPEEIADYNVIEVKNGKASVIEADCQDKVCYANGVCLPHKMTLKIYYDDWETDI